MSCRILVIELAISVSVVAAPAGGTETSVPYIKAHWVHDQGFTGRGVAVAVIDRGVDRRHPGLANDLAPGGMSFIKGEKILDGGESLAGEDHGTIVALIITDDTGVAPDAKILPLRVTGPSGESYPDDEAEAIKYAVDCKAFDPSIRVICFSRGVTQFREACPCDGPEFRIVGSELERAASTGIITFAASGNGAGCGDGVIDPACQPFAIPVAAIYDTQYPLVDPGCPDAVPCPGRVICLSQTSDSCEMLAAPGYDISVGGFEHWVGTSFASPHAAGVAALMFSKLGCTPWSYDAARRAILDSATQALSSCADVKYVQALAAVNRTPGLQCGLTNDLNCDGYIGFQDAELILGCLLGPSSLLPTDICRCAKFPRSSRGGGGVDLRDFAAFQLGFTGYAEGACCCFVHGDCRIANPETCLEDLNHPGMYQGHGTTCDGVQCDPGNWGACCHPDTQTCTESTRDGCIWGDPGLGDEGLYLGDGTRCATAACPALRYRNVIDPPTDYAPCLEGLQLADDITLEGDEPAGLAYLDLAVHGGSTGYFDVTVGLYTDCPGFGGTLIDGTERTFTDNPNYGAPVFLTATFDPPIYVPNHFWMVVSFSDESCGWFRADRAEAGFTADIFACNDSGDSGAPWVCNHWLGDELYAGFWADTGCTAPYGACCYTDQSCTDGTQAQCDAAGGYYQGPGTKCDTTDCSTTHVGACCNPDDASCTEVSFGVCAFERGQFQGEGTTCSGTVCPFGRYSDEAEPAIYTPLYYLADDMQMAGSGADQLEYESLMVYGGGGGTFSVTTSLYDGCPADGGVLIPGTTCTWEGIPGSLYDGNYVLHADMWGVEVTLPRMVWMLAEFTSPQGKAGWVIAGEAEVGYTLDVVATTVPPWDCYCGCQYGDTWAGFWANLRCRAPDARAREGGTITTWMTREASTRAAMGVAYPTGNLERPVRGGTIARMLSATDTALAAPAATPRLTAQPATGRPDPSTVTSIPDVASAKAGGRGSTKSRSTGTVTLALLSPRAGQWVQPGEEIAWSITASVSQGDNAGLALVCVDLVQDAANPQLFDLPPAAGPESQMEGFRPPDGIANPASGGAVSGYFGTPMGSAGASNLVQIGGAQNTFGEAGDTMGQNFTVDDGIGQAGPQLIASGLFYAPSTAGIYTFRLENGFANVLNVVQPQPAPPDFWPVSEADVAYAEGQLAIRVGTPMPVVFVDAGVASSGDGASWETAFQTLQQALSVAAQSWGATNEIWVAAGTYLPDEPYASDDPSATFQLQDGLAIYGGFLTGQAFWDRDFVNNVTTLSGNIGGTAGNSVHVVTGGGVGSTAVLDGFTISGGNANGSAYPNDRGGGVWNAAGSPTIRNCVIAQNSAAYGGGMSNAQGSPTISNCAFTSNNASYGGGVLNYGGSGAIITDCAFTGNTADYGAGMENETGSAPTIQRGTFSGNEAWVSGGGMHNGSGASPVLRHCTFTGNQADTGGGIYSAGQIAEVAACQFLANTATTSGGGLSNNGSGSYVNCVFSRNTAGTGAGFSNEAGNPSLTNCTFTGNVAAYEGGALVTPPGNVPTLVNCILWNDTPGEFGLMAGSDGFATYCDIAGGWPGTGNISEDPRLALPAEDNVHLLAVSPCINAGNNAAPHLPQEDYEGQARIQRGRVDMGADESPRIREFEELPPGGP